MAQKDSRSQSAIQPLAENPVEQKIVTVVGGGGFLGRFVVRALASRGYRVRIALRKPHQAMPLQPLGNVGQVVGVQANIRDRDSLIRAVRGACAVINLTGILHERGTQTFQAVHVDGAKVLAEVTPADAKFIQVSAIGADAQSPSVYARSKAAGEAAVLVARPDATIIRPSVIFGQGDGFFNRLATLSRLGPRMPVLGAETKLQPVFASDVAEVIACAVDGVIAGGKTYELGGPAVASMRELSEKVLTVVDRKKKLFCLSGGLASFAAYWVDLIDRLTLGIVMPRELVFTRDQVALLRTDNVVSDAAVAEGRTLTGLGIEPTAFDGIIPVYLERFRKAGEFENMRERRKYARRG